MHLYKFINLPIRGKKMQKAPCYSHFSHTTMYLIIFEKYTEVHNHHEPC